MGLSLYLSHRSYSLLADRATGKSLCHISSDWDCDQALNSSYSEWAGVPLSNWAFATYFIIALLILLLMQQGPAPQNQKNTSRPLSLSLSFFAILSAGASLFMLAVSVFVLKFFCPFCVLLYVLSFVVLFAVFFCFPPLSLVRSLFHSKKSGVSLSFSSVPGCFVYSCLIFTGLTFLTHVVFLSLYDIPSMKKTVRFNVMDWLSAPEKKPLDQALLSFGPDQKEALLTVTEFADFLCVHCRNVYYSLKREKIKPYMRVEFFSFPLDQCDGPSLSCQLTRAVYCAEQQQQGWAMHDLIFENQPLLVSLRNKDQEKSQETLKTFVQTLNLNQTLWQKCMLSSFAKRAEQEQIEAGKQWGVTGTPAVFVNGKKISHIYLTSTLKALHQHLKKD